jgi:hypothetical protein
MSSRRWASESTVYASAFIGTPATCSISMTTSSPSIAQVGVSLGERRPIRCVTLQLVFYGQGRDE